MLTNRGSHLFFFFLLLALWLPISTFCQFQITNETKLTHLLNVLRSQSPLKHKKVANDSLYVLLKDQLPLSQFPSKITFPQEIGSLTPSDSSFRLLLWPLSTGKTTFICCGLLQTKDSIYQLYDSLPLTEDRKNKIAEVRDWPGALYYKIIETRASGKRLYTLLGWNSSEPLWQSKVVDILWFDKNNIPHFGLKKFPFGQSRFILSYARNTSLSLRYERQTYYKKTWWSKNKVARIEPMIVFDRLVSSNNKLKNNPSFNLVAGNIFDALLWQNNMWVLKSDIDSRNPDSGKMEPTSSPKQGLKPPDSN